MTNLKLAIFQQVCDFNKVFFLSRFRNGGTNQIYIRREDLYDFAYSLEKAFSFLISRPSSSGFFGI